MIVYFMFTIRIQSFYTYGLHFFFRRRPFANIFLLYQKLFTDKMTL